MANDPTPFIPNEPVAGDGSIWQMIPWFKQVMYWAKRAFGVSVSKTASFTADESFFFPVDATSGAITCTLPSAATWTPGKPYVIKKTDSSANAVTVSRSGSDTIDGATSVTITARYSLVYLISDGLTTWHMLRGTPTGGGEVYQEGTFTPTWLGTVANPSVSYSAQLGSYTRIGRVCYFIAHLGVATVNVAGSGTLKLGGLPFTATADGTAAPGISFGFVNQPNGMFLTSGTAFYDIYKTLNTLSAATDLANGCSFWVNGFYLVA